MNVSAPVPVRVKRGRRKSMPKQKFPEAENRLFNRVFICMKCGVKNKGDLIKVRQGKIKCRKCKCKRLRQIHKDKKA